MTHPLSELPRDPKPDQKAPFTHAALARLCLAVAAQRIADTVSQWIPIPPTSITTRGTQVRNPADHTSVRTAHELLAQVEHFLVCAIVFERLTHATWEHIGRDLGDISRQSAHHRYGQAEANFRTALRAQADGDVAAQERHPLPAGADRPGTWGSRLDAWCQEHRWTNDQEHDPAPVTGGLTRLDPLLELMDTQAGRYALMTKHIFPPADQILPLLERELELWRQLGNAGHHHVGEADHDVAERIRDTEQRIAEVRARSDAR